MASIIESQTVVCRWHWHRQSQEVKSSSCPFLIGFASEPWDFATQRLGRENLGDRFPCNGLLAVSKFDRLLVLVFWKDNAGHCYLPNYLQLFFCRGRALQNLVQVQNMFWVTHFVVHSFVCFGTPLRGDSDEANMHIEYTVTSVRSKQLRSFVDIVVLIIHFLYFFVIRRSERQQGIPGDQPSCHFQPNKQQQAWGYLKLAHLHLQQKHQKMDGWKTMISFLGCWGGLFSRVNCQVVTFSVYIL